MRRYAAGFTETEIPETPDGLTTEEQQNFEQAARYLGARSVLGSADVVALECFAAAAAQARALDRAIAQQGAVDSKGKPHPLLMAASVAHTNVRSWARARTRSGRAEGNGKRRRRRRLVAARRAARSA